jgi:glycosyltransferase involved in cell wall biosynthesis
MKIGLDLRMIEGGSGIGRYVSEVSLAILENDKSNQYVLFFYELTPRLKSIYEKFGHKMVETKIKHYSFEEQLRLPGILRKEKLDLVHFPHFNVPIFYNRPFVVTIHDLTHTRFPGRKKSHFFHRVAYNAVLASAIKKSVRIIAVSEATKKEILEYFGVDSAKIQVVYEGINKNYKLLDKDQAFDYVTNRFSITKPYILYVGVWRRYKNLINLAKAFELLKKEDIDAQLVLVGEEDPVYPEIGQAIRSSKSFADMKVLGHVSDSDLNNLYNACSLCVLPSLAEGFGLTVLEAAAAGVPIACSDIPSLREVLGQAAIYFDPNNVENMTDVMINILHDPTRAEELANLGLARVRQFDWNKSAAETIKIYEGTLA